MFDRNLMELPKMRAVMAALVVLALAQAGCVVGYSLGLAGALSALREGAGWEAAAPALAQFAACFALLQLTQFAQNTMLDRVSVERAGGLRRQLLDRVFGDELLARRTGADALALVANDRIDEVESYLRVVPPKAVGLVALAVPLVACELALDWISGVIVAAMFPVIIFFMVLLGRQARDRSERQYAAYTRLTGRFMDTLRGMPVIRAFGAGEVEAEAVRENGESVRRATVATLRTATLSSAVLDLFATFAVAAVAIMLAFRLMDGSIDLFCGLVALMLAPECLQPLRGFASDFHASLDGKNALSEVLGLLAAEAGDSPRPAEDAEPETREAAASIRLENVSFSYPDGTQGARGITLSASGAERVAIIGASGSGKSTLANLLAGFSAPSVGRVAASPGWRDQVRYIPQAPHVFRATLDENLRFYRPDATRAEVERAASAVGLDSLVAELPRGLDTVVGEGARGLSGGEAHRVALARVLLDRDARVLVFDEPTAHLDVETELDLKATMLAAMEGKLVFFATHRLHWAADLDRIVELEGGRVVRDERREHAETETCRRQATGSGRSALPGSVGVAKSEAPQREKGERGSRRATPARLKALAAPHARQAALALALGTAAAACAALLMFASGYLISATALAATTLFSIMVPVACVQLFGLGRPAARYLERLASHDWVLRMTADLRMALFRAVERRAGDPARERAAGDYLALLADDVAHLQNLYLRVAFPVFVAWLIALGACVLAGAFSPLFALCLLAALALISVLMPVACLLVTRRLAVKAKGLKRDEYANLADDLQGSCDWVLAGREAHVREAHAAADRRVRELGSRQRLAERAFSLASSLLLGLVLCIIIWWAGGRFAGGNANWIAAFALGFFPLIELLAALPAAFAESTAHRSAVERLGVVGEDDPEGADLARERADEYASSGCAWRLGEVSYRYPGASRPALDGISLKIPAGQTLAVLGRSGAGKSTLARIMRGELAPDAGTVELPASAGGASLPVGYLGQDPYIFNRTLRDNLTMSVTDISDEALENVLKSVGLESKLGSLECGLDTVVGETGAGFSGGEAHRVALARVLAADAPAVIVDEPFAALDPQTESALVDTLLDACVGRTLVVITHHLAHIDRFDRVIFVEDGKVALDGSPFELAATSPRFRELLAFDRPPIMGSALISVES